MSRIATSERVILSVTKRIEDRIMASLQEVLDKAKVNTDKATAILQHFDQVDAKFTELNTLVADLKVQLEAAGVPQDIIDQLDTAVAATGNVLDLVSGRQAGDGTDSGAGSGATSRRR